MNLRLFTFLAAVTVALVPSVGQADEPRLALVVGNADYENINDLSTPENDASLVAEALEDVGFTVTSATDVDGETLREQFAEFTQSVVEAGPDAVAIVYLSGHALLADGSNFFLPVDAELKQAEDVGRHGLSMDDVLSGLAGTPARVRVAVLDGARTVEDLDEETFGLPGLGAVLLPEQTIAVLSAQPGAVVAETDEDSGGFASSIAKYIGMDGDNSAFAASFAKYIGAPTLNIEEALRQTRCAVYDVTRGSQLPWSSSTLTATFIAGEADGEAPADACAPIGEQVASGETSGGSVQTYIPVPREESSGERISRDALGDMSADEGYRAVINDGSVAAYESFVEVYPDDPRAWRFRNRIDARAEHEVWINAVQVNTVEVYVTYLERYPYGAYRRHALARIERFGGRAPDLPPPPSDWRERRRPRAVMVGPGHYSHGRFRPGYFDRDRRGGVIDIARPGFDRGMREEIELYRLERQSERLEELLRREERRNERARLIEQRRELRRRIRKEREEGRERLERARAELEEQIEDEREAAARERLEKRREELEERLQERKERAKLIAEREKLEEQLQEAKKGNKREKLEKQRAKLQEQLREKREARVKEIEAETGEDVKIGEKASETRTSEKTPDKDADKSSEKASKSDDDEKSGNRLLPKPANAKESGGDDEKKSAKPGDDGERRKRRGSDDGDEKKSAKPGGDRESERRNRRGDDEDGDGKSRNRLLPKPAKADDGDEKKSAKPGDDDEPRKRRRSDEGDSKEKSAGSADERERSKRTGKDDEKEKSAKPGDDDEKRSKRRDQDEKRKSADDERERPQRSRREQAEEPKGEGRERRRREDASEERERPQRSRQREESGEESGRSREQRQRREEAGEERERPQRGREREQSQGESEREPRGRQREQAGEEREQPRRRQSEQAEGASERRQQRPAREQQAEQPQKQKEEDNSFLPWN